MPEILYYENGRPKTAADFQSIPKKFDGFTWRQTPGAVQRIIFLSIHGAYKKGDILWLEPQSYETQTTPPAGGSISYPYTVPAAEAFMGKARTYSAQTNYRQYAVRLRALVDNPRNPSIVGAIGTDWAVDDPAAIVEEGSNANGRYEILANYMVSAEMKKQHSGMAPNTSHGISMIYPVSIQDAALTHYYLVGSGGGMGVNYQGNVGASATAEQVVTSITSTSCTHTYSSPNVLNGLAVVRILGAL